MKTILHYPIEQYGFVSLEYDNNEEVSDEAIKNAINAYNRVSEASKGRAGLADKEFRQFIDNQLSDKSIHIDDYEKMNDYQIFAVQTIKRAKKRNK